MPLQQPDTRVARIRELNDAFRKTFAGGKMVMSASVAALPDIHLQFFFLGGGGGGAGGVKCCCGLKTAAGCPTWLGLGPVSPLTAPSPGSRLRTVSVDVV